VIVITLAGALLLPKGYAGAFLGDSLQVGLLAAATFLALQNSIRSNSQIRVFWLLMFIGFAMWLISMTIWATYELWLQRPLPDSPLVDTLLFLKLVPFASAAALEAHQERDSRYRAFGLLDLLILIFYSLYLFAFFVYAYRLMPGATDTYNFHFNVADTIGNQLLAVVTGIAYLRERGPSRPVYRIFFIVAALYCLASDLIDVAIDLGHYYTGSFYDLPLNAALAGFVCLCLAGRPSLHNAGTRRDPQATGPAPTWGFTFLSSYLAMLVTFSTPAIGLWLLTTNDSPKELYSFRLDITLLAIFLLTMLLSIKQDFLSNNLARSLQVLSHTYTSIDRFKDHLVQSEKLAALGQLVASVSTEIKDAMALIREQALRITSRTDVESRSQSLAGKIGQYAQRTDVLVENMQRFAQETPLQLAPVDVKPLLESALHLSRISKLSNLTVQLEAPVGCPPVLGDSSQLLHAFLQLISNAIDAMEDAGGGELAISVRPCEPQVCIQFADTGTGIKYPEHVFEPFFTTKPVGKGTGLGLSTCYGIIRQHDGDISCSNRLGGGAVFTIFLPAVGVPEPQVREASSVLVEGPR
jgi:signal transduction histidine kinase